MNTIPWETIRLEYISSGASQRALAKKYGINPSTVGRRAKAEHWREQRNNHRVDTAERALDMVAAEKATSLADLEHIYSTYSRLVEERLHVLTSKLPEEVPTAELVQMGGVIRSLVQACREVFGVPTVSEKINMRRQELEEEKWRHTLEHEEKEEETAGFTILLQMPDGNKMEVTDTYAG